MAILILFIKYVLEKIQLPFVLFLRHFSFKPIESLLGKFLQDRIKLFNNLQSTII